MDENKSVKRNLLFLSVLIVITCINLFVILPINTRSGTFSKGIFVTLNERVILFAINAPILVVLLIYFRKFLSKLKYFNFISYPLMIINIIIPSQANVCSIASYGMSLILLAYPMFVLPLLLVLSLIYGLVLDVRAWREYAKLKRNK